MTDHDPDQFAFPEQVTESYYDPDWLEAVRAAARSDLQVVSVLGESVEGMVEPSVPLTPTTSYTGEDGWSCIFIKRDPSRDAENDPRPGNRQP